MVKQNRKRYILFEIVSDIEVNINSAKTAINESCFQFLGERGISEARPILLPEFWKKNIGVLAVNNRYVNEAKTCLALIKEIDRKKVIFRTKKVFGTLKKIKIILRR